MSSSGSRKRPRITCRIGSPRYRRCHSTIGVSSIKEPRTSTDGGGKEYNTSTSRCVVEPSTSSVSCIKEYTLGAEDAKDTISSSSHNERESCGNTVGKKKVSKSTSRASNIASTKSSVMRTECNRRKLACKVKSSEYNMTGMSSPEKEQKVQKKLVRHCEPKVRIETVVQRVSSKLPLSDITDTSQQVTRDYKSRYAVPELYSSLTCAKAIKDDKIQVSKSMKSIKPTNLKLIDAKASRKVNFSPEEKLFKDLVKLDIGNELVKKTTRRRVVKLSKDTVPNLSDIYEPSFKGEYTVDMSDLKYQSTGKQCYYNGFAITERILGWETTIVDDAVGKDSDCDNYDTDDEIEECL